ncbi:hypothetical protein LXL04_008625 [Taraxacum kok-saghyz]
MEAIVEQVRDGSSLRNLPKFRCLIRNQAPSMGRKKTIEPATITENMILQDLLNQNYQSVSGLTERRSPEVKLKQPRGNWNLNQCLDYEAFRSQDRSKRKVKRKVSFHIKKTKTLEYPHNVPIPRDVEATGQQKKAKIWDKTGFSGCKKGRYGMVFWSTLGCINCSKWANVVIQILKIILIESTYENGAQAGHIGHKLLGRGILQVYALFSVSFDCVSQKLSRRNHILHK